MNFTREPIIETVIAARDGCTLVIRSSKSSGGEEYLVESVEVVSFGHSFFFRSEERSKSFLVPVSDYEVVELKEARMALKTVSSDRAIKIGGGRDAPPRVQEPHDAAFTDSRPAPVTDARNEQRSHKREHNKRRRGRRGRDRHEQGEASQQQPPREQHRESQEEHRTSEEHQSTDAPAETKAPSFISKLFPPPQTLIKDTIGRYKTMDAEGVTDKPVEPQDESSEDENEE